MLSNQQRPPTNLLFVILDEEVKAEVMAVLKNIFGHDVPEAEEILIPRLHSDPFFQGSYSDWPLG